MDDFKIVLMARKRVESVEQDILGGKKPQAAVLYADWVIRGRWREAEPIIMQDAESAARYAEVVIRHRWKEAEPTIMQSAKAASIYASRVIRGRWREAEPIICKAEAARYYARDVLAGRWDKKVAAMCPCWLCFFAKSECGGKLPTDLHNLMLLEAIKNVNDPWVRKYLNPEERRRPRKSR